MGALSETRLRQLEHAGTTMKRELSPAGDQVEAYAKFSHAMIGRELRKPFPEWPRIKQLALNLAEACDA